MKQYTINAYNWLDVSMYNTILSPEVVFDEATEDDWKDFDMDLYRKKICELAETELRTLLKDLPEKMKVTYIEGSAEIDSPSYYNYRTDWLIFRMCAKSKMTENEMNNYLDEFFAETAKDEFGATYNIYEKLCENYGIEDFFH